MSSRSTSDVERSPVSVRGVAAEDLDQPVALLDQLRGGDLLLGLAQEVLLAGGAHDVGVLVAEAHVLERLAPAHALVAGLDVDVRVGGGVVEVAPVDVRVDAADRVDRPPEAAEVTLITWLIGSPVTAFTVRSVSFGPPSRRRR